MTDETSGPDLPTGKRKTGDTAFGAICFLFSAFLFSQMWSQTVWASGQGFAAQPAFWPRLAVIGMLLLSGVNLVGSILDSSSRERLTGLGEEVSLWLRSFEFAIWFMAYVFATPVIGYLLSSVLFAAALAVRVGYRSPKALGAAILTGCVTVLLFKSFLQVKIPGGSIYEHLPDGLRNFFIIYL